MSGVSNRKFLYFKLYINNLSKRFAYATSGRTYNTTSDFPTTGSGFGVNTQALTLYAGFVIPEYSRICFMNYGDSPDAAISAVAQSGDIYSAFRNGGIWQNGKISASKNDLLISASGTGPTDWTALETTVNMPFKIWNVTKASTSKGAPAGCYDYGTLIALVATATGDRWRNTLIYLPDNNNNVGNKVYVRSGISTKWLAISGTDVNSVS